MPISNAFKANKIASVPEETPIQNFDWLKFAKFFSNFKTDLPRVKSDFLMWFEKILIDWFKILISFIKFMLIISS